MENLNDLLENLLPEQTPLVLPDEVPQNLELVHLAMRTTKAVLSKENLSSADAALLEALTRIRNSYMEY